MNCSLPYHPDSAHDSSGRPSSEGFSLTCIGTIHPLRFGMQAVSPHGQRHRLVEYQLRTFHITGFIYDSHGHDPFISIRC